MAEVCESPCPTCGEDSLWIARPSGKPNAGKFRVIACTTCGACGRAQLWPHEGNDPSRRTAVIKRWVTKRRVHR